MYAIVEIAGQQFKVEKEQEIFVHRLEGDAGSSVEFDQVLLLDNAGKVTVGTPTVNGALIKAKIVEHMKGDKVLVFHKKRRKGYQKENGHRQSMSKVIIEDIMTGAKKTAAKKVEPKKEAAPKAKAEAAPKAEKKAAPKAKAEDKVEAKETKKPAAKTTAKKPAEKKAAAPKAEKKEAAPKAEKKEAAPKAAKKAAPKAAKKDEPKKEEGDSKE